MIRILPALPWRWVPAWLAEAAVVIVPSRRETFGLVALEALSVGTPVVAYDLDNLPALVGAGGVLVPPEAGPEGLWRAAMEITRDPLAYQTSATTWEGSTMSAS